MADFIKLFMLLVIIVLVWSLLAEKEKVADGPKDVICSNVDIWFVCKDYGLPVANDTLVADEIGGV